MQAGGWQRRWGGKLCVWGRGGGCRRSVALEVGWKAGEGGGVHCHCLLVFVASHTCNGACVLLAKRVMAGAGTAAGAKSLCVPPVPHPTPAPMLPPPPDIQGCAAGGVRGDRADGRGGAGGAGGLHQPMRVGWGGVGVRVGVGVGGGACVWCLAHAVPLQHVGDSPGAPDGSHQPASASQPASQPGASCSAQRGDVSLARAVTCQLPPPPTQPPPTSRSSFGTRSIRFGLRHFHRHCPH